MENFESAVEARAAVFQAMLDQFNILWDVADHYHETPYTDITMAHLIGHACDGVGGLIDKAMPMINGIEYMDNLTKAKRENENIHEFAEAMSLLSSGSDLQLHPRVKRAGLNEFLSEMARHLAEASKLAGCDNDIYVSYAMKQDGVGSVPPKN